MSSNSRVIREEDLPHYQRWEAPSVQGPVVGGMPQGGEGGGMMSAGRLQELERIAREDGFKAGYADGLEAGRRELDGRLRQFDDLLAALATPLDQVDEAVEHELVALALAVARQLVRREIRTSPGEIVAVVREAMAALPSASRELELRLHPEDALLVRDALNLAEGGRNLRLVDDPVLTRGGCTISTDIAQVDATLESRLNAVITEVLGGERQRDGGA
jgi:flagellar assembly protein FliH